jgi:hypothetical protein
MTVNKTRATEASVAAFVDALEPARRLDAKAVIRMMKSATGEKPKMWGPSIIGRRGVTGQVGWRHTIGKGCLYIKNLSDVDQKILEELIVESVTGRRAS